MTVVYDCQDAATRQEGIDAAVSALKAGELVVMPTDTVYGLGCDAFDSSAVTALLAAKGRGRDMPVGVLVGSWHTIDGLVFAVPAAARELVEAFWPGPLSIIVRHAPSLSWDLGDAQGSVMLRMPMHPVAIELLRAVGPMAVSSANVSAGPRRSPPPKRAVSWTTRLRCIWTADRPSWVRLRPSSISPARYR